MFHVLWFFIFVFYDFLSFGSVINHKINILFVSHKDFVYFCIQIILKNKILFKSFIFNCL